MTLDGARILVVDDQGDIRDLAGAILEAEGYRVATAGDGEEALEAIFRDPFDLVLLDINMPGMDGWETLRLLRADDDGARLRVVLFSVRGEIRNKVQAMQLGASGYITKPFSMDELVSGVREHLRDGSGPAARSGGDARPA